MNELLDRLKVTRWWTIIKALPFDGGPSSTRWVFLGAFTAVTLCLLAVTGSICWVFVHSTDHHTDVALLGLAAAWVTALLGFAANAQNLKHTLIAKTCDPITDPAAPADGK